MIKIIEEPRGDSLSIKPLLIAFAIVVPSHHSSNISRTFIVLLISLILL